MLWRLCKPSRLPEPLLEFLVDCLSAAHIMIQHPHLPTPSEMIAHLDRHVYGQTRAKRDLAVAVYNHYVGQAVRDEGGEDLGRFHLLLIGPTGVGKTYLVKVLAEYLGVPVGVASAAGLVESGYKGNSVETVLGALMTRAGGDPKKAERGMVFLDEVDKIRRGEGGGRDVSGEGVQNALLTYLDGRRTSGLEGREFAEIDTGRLLFVCTGAFVGLETIVERRLGTGRHRIGFHPRPQETPAEYPDQPVYEALCQAGTGDLVEFGMIPEFIGRFATVSVLHELSRGALRSILTTEMEHSALARQMRLAALHGIRLLFEDEALEALADEASALKTGARGLARLIGKAVDAVDHRWPELADEGVTEVRVTPGTVLRGEAPVLVKGSMEGLVRRDAELRARCLGGLPPRRSLVLSSAERPEHTDTSAWSDRQLREGIERLKSEHLGWQEMPDEVRSWWEAFEEGNRGREAQVFRLAEELVRRQATIADFVLASDEADTDSIPATLHYLDYRRLKGGGRGAG